MSPCRLVSGLFVFVVGHVLQAHIEEPLSHVIHVQTQGPVPLLRPDTSLFVFTRLGFLCHRVQLMPPDNDNPIVVANN